MDRVSRPVGPLVDFKSASWPSDKTIAGQSVRLEAMDAKRHAARLWDALAGHNHVWDYLLEQPPRDASEFVEYLQSYTTKPGWQGYAVCLPDGTVPGYAFYLNIVPAMGTIEVGNINFSPALQRTRAATEAMFLMMQYAFDLGYRRYEWKCNSLNAPSRRAAQRLGFSWEGIFRQHLIVKGLNRDTAWLAMTDQEWPRMKMAFETWLDPQNFDENGHQRQSLSDLTGPLRVASDPDQKVT